MKSGERVPPKTNRLSLQEDIEFVGQMVASLEDSAKELEKNYSEEKLSEFAETKKFMKQIQKKISGIIT